MVNGWLVASQSQSTHRQKQPFLVQICNSKCILYITFKHLVVNRVLNICQLPWIIHWFPTTPPPFPCSSSCVICISVRPCTGSPFGSNSASHRTTYNTNCSVKGSACCRWSPQYMQSGSRNSGISCCTRWYCAMILGEGRLHHLLLLLYLKYKMSGYISVYIYSWVGYTLRCPSDTIFEHLSKLHFERSKFIFDKVLFVTITSVGCMSY